MTLLEVTLSDPSLLPYTSTLSPKIAPFPGLFEYPSNKWLLGPIWVSTRHSSWIYSAVFVGVKVVSDRQTTCRPHNIGNNVTVGRILMFCIRWGVVTDKCYNKVASWFSSVCCQENSVHIVNWTFIYFNNMAYKYMGVCKCRNICLGLMSATVMTVFSYIWQNVWLIDWLSKNQRISIGSA